MSSTDRQQFRVDVVNDAKLLRFFFLLSIIQMKEMTVYTCAFLDDDERGS